MKQTLVISLFCAMLAISACGGGDSTPTTQAGNGAGASTTAQLPKAEVPAGRAPTKLVIEELKVGTGPQVKATDAVVVAYEGVSFKTGKRFDIRTRSEPFFFQTAVGRVMPGFDKAVIGMKVGGQRQVVIPPDLTLNELGKPETLVYSIEMLSDESAARYHHRLEHGEPLSLSQFG